MSGALRHRGPDGHGHYEEPEVFLDVNRLAIVDVAAGASPPSTARSTTTDGCEWTWPAAATASGRPRTAR